MKARTKLYIASYTASALMMLGVFSHPLGIPTGVSALLSVIAWIPLCLVIVYIKKIKKEQATDSTFAKLEESEMVKGQRKTKNRLIYLWMGTIAFTSSSPLWEPAISGVHLSATLNFIVALSSISIISAIFGIRLLANSRKQPNCKVNWMILWPGIIASGLISAICAFMFPANNGSSSAVSYNNAGFAMAKNGDWDGAIADYDRALKLDPSLAMAYGNRGEAKYHLSDFTGAIADFNDALKLNPNFAAVYNDRGLVKSRLGDNEGAIADCTRALELNPQSAIAYNNRGVSKAKKGDNDGAMADYNRAVELDPKFAHTYNNRGWLKAAKGDNAGAIADYNHAIELDSKFADPYNNRGWAKAQNGDYSGATLDYNMAIELNPKYALAYVNRSAARTKMGDLAGAEADMTQAHQLDPNIGK